MRGLRVTKKQDDAAEAAAELETLELEYAQTVSPMIDHFMLLGSVRKAMLNAEHAASCAAEEAHWKQRDVFETGDRVVIKGSALFAMGQRTGRDAARVWVIVECGCELCGTGRLVAVDQWVDEIGWRHIGKSALRHVGQPTVDELPVWATDMDTASIEAGRRLAKLSTIESRPANDVGTADADAQALAAFEALTALPWKH